jgi:hypothetical protein
MSLVYEFKSSPVKLPFWKSKIQGDTPQPKSVNKIEDDDKHIHTIYHEYTPLLPTCRRASCYIP